MIENENPVLEALTKPATTATPDPGAAASPGGDAVSAAIAGASAKAVSEHNATANEPKRGRGRPRKIPVAGLDSQPGQVLLGEARPKNSPGLDPAFDDATAETLVEAVLEGLNDIAGSLQKSAAKRFYAMDPDGGDSMAASAEKSARMSEKTYENAKASGKVLVKKYLAAQMAYAPEISFGLAIGLWAIGNVRSYKAMESEYRAKIKRQNGQA